MLNGRQKPGQEVRNQWPSMAGFASPGQEARAIGALSVCPLIYHSENHPNLDSEARTARSRGWDPPPCCC